MWSSIAIVLGLTGLLETSEAATLVRRGWKFSEEDAPCISSKRDIITKEIGYALEMARYTSAHTTDGPFFGAMFSGSPGFEGQAQAIFTRITNMLDPNNHDYDFTVQCDDTSDMCSSGRYFAHMSDKRQTMNFCESFFVPKPDGTADFILATEQRLAEGTDSTIDLRKVQRSRSAVIVHECAHTGYATGLPQGRALDYVYGYNGCWLLNRHLWNRKCTQVNAPSKKILCPDPKDPTKEGLCDADRATYNADSYSFVAAGVWFSAKFNKEVALPADPPTPPNLKQIGDGCPSDDSIPFDLDDDAVPPSAASTLDVMSTTAPPGPGPTVYCTNPSLEDGDGICTCNIGTYTFTTFTPSGGPGNDCHASTLVPPSLKRAVYTTIA